MHTAIVDLLLDYEVTHPAHFLFHIETAFHDSNRVLEERLTITPSMKLRTFFTSAVATGSSGLMRPKEFCRSTTERRLSWLAPAYRYTLKRPP